MRTATWTPDPERKPATDTNRPLALHNPCECGCDQRDGPSFGYLTHATETGGFSIIAETPEERTALEHIAGVLAVPTL